MRSGCCDCNREITTQPGDREMTHRIGGFIAAMGFLVVGGVAGAAEGPVKIGVLNDMTSVYSDAGGKGALEAAIMAAEDAGLVLGHKVESVSADHQNKPDVRSVIARQWYERDGVDMITNVPN